MKKLGRLVTLFLLLCSLGAPLLAGSTAVALQGATPDQQNPNALNPSDSVSNICKNADPTNLPPVCQQSQVDQNTPNPIYGPHGILTTVINLLSLLVGVISVFVIIIAGVKLITSSGDPNSVTESRNAILYAVIALAITASAQLFVRFILSKLGS